MAIELFRFIFNTLREAGNDPQSPRYWLPKVLADADGPGGGKLLPIHAQQWNLGTVTGEGGVTFRDAIKAQWWTVTGALWRRDKDPRWEQLRQHQPIACPDAPWPSLSLPSATVTDMNNVYIMDNPPMQPSADGYTTTVTLQFGHYTDRPDLHQVHLEGEYQISQWVCSAAVGGQECDGFVARAQVNGGGTVKLTVTDLWIDADVAVTVAGTGPARTLQVAINKLTAHGGTAGALPQIAVDDLEIDTAYQGLKDLWITAATNALTSQQGRAGIAANLNETLNRPDLRQSLGTTLTQQLGRVIDATLGLVPPGALPSTAEPAANPVDTYLFDRVRLTLNDPGSEYYLPKVVTASSDPVLEPVSIGTVSIGTLSLDGASVNDVTLQTVVLAGVSNIKAPVDQLTTLESRMQATLTTGALDPPPTVTVRRGGVPTQVRVPPPPLRITGTFTCTLGGMPLGGGFTVVTGRAQVYADASATGADAPALQVQFRQVELRVALADMRIEVQIDSVFRDTVNRIFNTDDVKQKALTAVNTQLAAHRGDLGERASQALRKQIAAQIGG